QEPDVGYQFQHQLELALVAVLTRLPLARAAVCRSGEARVAPAAAPAFRHEQRVPARERFTDHLPRRGVAHLGAGRNREVEIGPGLAGHVLALAVLPALRLPLGAVAVVEERREVRVGAHEHAAARSTIPAVGAALGDELFAAERGGACAARPADYMDDRPIYEHCGLRIADCGLARPVTRPIRPVRMESTAIA